MVRLVPPPVIDDQVSITGHAERRTRPVLRSENILIALFSVPGSGALTNQYAAMPSMHAGWALWCVLTIVGLARHGWIKALGARYPGAAVFVIERSYRMTKNTFIKPSRKMYV